MLPEPAERRVALITGSTSGIGAALARLLSADGFRVVLNSARSTAAGAELASELEGAHYLRADVSDPDEASGLVEGAVERMGRLDAVFTCAGTSVVIPFDDFDAADDAFWQRSLGVNLMGVWNVIRAAVPHLGGPDPSIVNITSVAGIRTSGASIPYAVSKAAVNHMTRLLAWTLAPRIRVNAVAPGFVDTPLTAAMPVEYRDGYERTAPLGRVGDVDDVIGACRYLLDANFTTGQILAVDGGMTIL